MEESKLLRNKLLCVIELNTLRLGELMDLIGQVEKSDPDILNDIEIKHALRVLNEQFLK